MRYCQHIEQGDQRGNESATLVFLFRHGPHAVVTSPRFRLWPFGGGSPLRGAEVPIAPDASAFILAAESGLETTMCQSNAM